MTQPTYETTKKFVDFMKGVRPEFKIESDKKLDDREYYPSLGGMQNALPPAKLVSYGVPLITTDTLHAILWELVKPKMDLYNSLIMKYFFKSALLPGHYGTIQPSLWESNPDEVLEDIMNNYIEFKK